MDDDEMEWPGEAEELAEARAAQEAEAEVDKGFKVGPIAADPDAVAEAAEANEQWVSDWDDLTGPETDRCLKLIGVGADKIGEYPFSLACAIAVVIRKRTDPSVPYSRWRTLKVSDLDQRTSVDPADATDPT